MATVDLEYLRGAQTRRRIRPERGSDIIFGLLTEFQDRNGPLTPEQIANFLDDISRASQTFKDIVRSAPNNSNNPS